MAENQHTLHGFALKYAALIKVNQCNPAHKPLITLI